MFHIKNWVLIMAFTRAKVDSLSKEKLLEELIKFEDISNQLHSLKNLFDEFTGKYYKLHSELYFQNLLVNHKKEDLRN